MLQAATESPSGVTHYRNPAADARRNYSDDLRDIVSIDSSRKAQSEIRQWPNYHATPLHELKGFASDCGTRRVWYKDESQRFGLKSFKALGGSYAVAMQLIAAIERETGERPTMEELFSLRYADLTNKVTVATATDGNHGRSVAWGAKMFGCSCVIYIHADVSEVRERKMAELGADVRRISGNYDDSVKEVAHVASEHGWIIVSDNSYTGYVDIPKDIAAGYTVMLQEIVEQLGGAIPSHVLVQGGCGGLASAVCGYFWDLWGRARPRLVVVEPEQANCLQLSARSGQMSVVGGKLETLMAGLACGEVSQLAWQILALGADDFTTLPERFVPVAMQKMQKGQGGDPSLEAGESAVAGVGILLAATQDSSLRANLGLTSESGVLLLGTEGATDPELYAELTCSGTSA